jgi:hypothetical protein
LAEAAAQKARAAAGQAKLAQAEAARQQAIADARALANRSGTLLRQHPEEASRSLEYAVASMNKSNGAGFRSVEADTALRESLALIPRLRDSHQGARQGA